MKKSIYGPVLSRRLGYSLGVDCVPFKTCSYDCIYCQLGKSATTTVDRRPYISFDTVLEELREKINKDIRMDYITLGGSGEPTLHTEIGTLIHRIKGLTDTPVAVLTNGSLLADTAVQRSLMEADVVLPSMDAYEKRGFEKINRPHPSIVFDDMVAGLVAFGKTYPGKIWLEVFILDGINDSEEDAHRFKVLIDRINPDKIHLNTAVRPTTERLAKPVSVDKLEAFCAVLGDKAEIAFNLRTLHEETTLADIDTELLNLLARRPCTLDDLASGLRADKNAIRIALQRLTNHGKIEALKKEGTDYYQWVRNIGIKENSHNDTKAQR